MLHQLRYRLRRLSSIAMLAIFGLAFAPTISHALNHARGDSIFNEICTPEGMKQMSADTADQGDSSGPPALNHMDHCPLCGLTAGGMVMAVASPALAEPSNLSHLLPALFLHAPRPLFAWASVQARAPPGLA
ncbi:MAG: DUF2946 domain-containing protein [Vitreoscilla sp.]|nr:DUF2946 domain-containing protein [Burkholderiales bacterium]MBP6338462.1 DUF2946 domain-containing protein [Vitreoscilla sp.]MBP6676293.1 DUF2946 domain-containing protein [Vitreoscilla sp.]